MKIKHLLPMALLPAILAMTGCDDFFEKNLSHKSVTIIAPSNGVTVPEGTVTFSWKALDGAVDYQLIIVSPAFESASRLVADTTLTGVQFSTRLSAGAYQWYLIPRNTAYEGKSGTYDLNVIKPDTP